jgi:hypothetical protein
MNNTKLEIEFAIAEEDNTIHIQLKGFDNFEDAEKYCEFLHKYAKLIFFNSEVAH